MQRAQRRDSAAARAGEIHRNKVCAMHRASRIFKKRSRTPCPQREREKAWIKTSSLDSSVRDFIANICRRRFGNQLIREREYMKHPSTAAEFDAGWLVSLLHHTHAAHLGHRPLDHSKVLSGLGMVTCHSAHTGFAGCRSFRQRRCRSFPQRRMRID